MNNGTKKRRTRGPALSPDQKLKIGRDALEHGPTKAASMNRVSYSSAYRMLSAARSNTKQAKPSSNGARSDTKLAQENARLKAQVGRLKEFIFDHIISE